MYLSFFIVLIKVWWPVRFAFLGGTWQSAQREREKYESRQVLAAKFSGVAATLHNQKQKNKTDGRGFDATALCSPSSTDAQKLSAFCPDGAISLLLLGLYLQPGTVASSFAYSPNSSCNKKKKEALCSTARNYKSKRSGCLGELCSAANKAQRQTETTLLSFSVASCLLRSIYTEIETMFFLRVPKKSPGGVRRVQ